MGFYQWHRQSLLRGGAKLKLRRAALTADFRAGCSSCSRTNSFVTNAVLIERTASCWHLCKLLWQTTQYLDSWLPDLLYSKLKMKLSEVEGAHAPVPHSWRRNWILLLFLFLLLKVKMYVRNGYNGDSETVNVLARHTALKRWNATEIRWYRNIVSCGSAVQSMALLPISAMRLWASSDKGPRVSTATGKNVSGGARTVPGRLSRRRGRCSTSCL